MTSVAKVDQMNVNLGLLNEMVNADDNIDDFKLKLQKLMSSDKSALKQEDKLEEELLDFEEVLETEMVTLNALNHLAITKDEVFTNKEDVIGVDNTKNVSDENYKLLKDSVEEFDFDQTEQNMNINYNQELKNKYNLLESKQDYKEKDEIIYKKGELLKHTINKKNHKISYIDKVKNELVDELKSQLIQVVEHNETIENSLLEKTTADSNKYYNEKLIAVNELYDTLEEFASKNDISIKHEKLIEIISSSLNEKASEDFKVNAKMIAKISYGENSQNSRYVITENFKENTDLVKNMLEEDMPLDFKQEICLSNNKHGDFSMNFAQINSKDEREISNDLTETGDSLNTNMAEEVSSYSENSDYSQAISSKEIINQLAEKIDYYKNFESEKLVIQLKPENLGEVVIDVQKNKQGYVANITVETEIVRTSLRENSSELISVFSNREMNLNNMEIHVRSESLEQANPMSYQENTSEFSSNDSNSSYKYENRSIKIQLKSLDNDELKNKQYKALGHRINVFI